MAATEGHHLILGQLTDAVSGETLPDTHDERYRQKLAHLLMTRKGFLKEDIQPRCNLEVRAGERQALIRVDFKISLAGRACMIIKYAPGSLVTRHRPCLAMSRILTGYQIPVVVVTNGEDADVLEGASGRTIVRGLDKIPSRDALLEQRASFVFKTTTAARSMRESRIVYAYEVDDSCPCDDNICRPADDDVQMNGF